MPISNYVSPSSHDLLDCRMAMLGLDLSAAESRDAEMFQAITRRELQRLRMLRIGAEARSQRPRVADLLSEYGYWCFRMRVG
jgi:hypothetical protein